MRADEQAGVEQDTAAPDPVASDAPGSDQGSDWGSDWGAPAELSDGTSAEASDGEPIPTIWVDKQTFEIVRIESLTRVAIELGPTVTWDELRFPESITIFEPDKEPVRLEVGGVTPVNAPAAEFGRSWLLAPASELPTSPRPAPTFPTPPPSRSTPPATAPATPVPPGAP